MPLPIGRKLRDYLPHILREGLHPIMESEEPHFEQAWLMSVLGLDEVYAATATEYGIKRFERYLKLQPTLADTLEDRRFAVLAALMVTIVITERTTIQLMDNLLGPGRYEYDLDFRNYRITVTLRLNIRRKVEMIRSLLRQRLPANLEIDIRIAYNTHDILHGFNHFDLANYTHEQLRTEQLTHTEYNLHETLVYTRHNELSKLTHEEIMTHPF